MRVNVYWPKDKKFYLGTIVDFNSRTNKFKIDYDDGDSEDLDLDKENWHVVGDNQSSSESLAFITNVECTEDLDLEPLINGIKVFVSKQAGNDKNRFVESRRKEIVGLLEKGVFKPVHKSLAAGQRIFGSRFVDDIKNQGTSDEYLKSRLVVQGFNDKGHGLLTHAPTVQRSSQRLILALATMFPDWKLILRDIVQAYTQSLTKLHRRIYVKPVPEFGLSDEMVLQVVMPLYGVPESGLHWFNTYQIFHKEKLGMKPSAHDLCLLFTPNGPELDKENKPAAITCLQTDDSLFLANEEFESLEEEKSSTFERKPILKLAESVPLKFNGSIVSKTCSGITMSAAVSEKSLLKPIQVDPVDIDGYVAQRARGAYIASMCRPDLAYGFSSAAQYSKPETDQARFLNKYIKTCIQSKDQKLNFVKLEIETLTISVFVDAAFANNTDNSSQLGFLTVLMDQHYFCNIVHYRTCKCKRVTRSVLASELYAMVLGFDQSYVIKQTIESFLGRKIPLHVFTDSKSLFDSLTSLNTTTEKRLLIDLSLLRECYERNEIAEVFWIPGDQNPADGLTKKNACKALENLMSTNKVDISPKAWIERDSPSWSNNKK